MLRFHGNASDSIGLAAVQIREAYFSIARQLHPDRLSALGIPDDQIVICGLALGYADPDAVPNNLITERAPIADFTKWFSE